MIIWTTILAGILAAAVRMFGNSISFELNNYGPKKTQKVKTWYQLGAASSFILGGLAVLIFLKISGGL